ncbi:hypothetical protein [Desulfuromonas thiophila]|uniref:hypothetical protein n=1 Tax=Desulfuromonas thiophila TaxID=57664 RepID=UPI001495AD74|nr:hypothetical protein [Desulfuromonas thiophila]MCK9172667.1 hypothetical protein [Desulfuromonas thiophila]MDD3801798.1 hypothetical protein [Desulfuromonas thiophila]MDY0397881.1 hypothetical protein [Desulfuromonas thiophila]
MATESPRYNSLCERCLRSCRQLYGTRLLECPRFLPKPFFIPVKKNPRQLDLF